MVELSRRAVLAAGAVALGTTAAAVAVFSPRDSPATAIAPTPAPTPTPTLPPSPAPQALPPVQLGAPVLEAAIAPRTTGAVMQQVERLPTGELFFTQSLSGTAPFRFTTVVVRAAGSPVAPEIDAMTIVDGGHGLGLHVNPLGGGGYDIWTSLQGAVGQGDPMGGRLARFRYTPGVFTIDAIPGGVVYLPQFPNDQGLPQEAIYSFDSVGGFAVERMYDFNTGQAERYTRRSIDDLVSGIDRPYGRMTLPVNPPTMQGFTTVDGRLFRWIGSGNNGSGAVVASDPMAMEQFDWVTGTRIAVTTFPTLGQDASGRWRDDTYEPEGCSVLRAPDGTVSLVVGVTTGRGGDHAWPVYRLPIVG